jgi:DNA-binding XRE family transcriptional regulator
MRTEPGPDEGEGHTVPTTKNYQHLHDQVVARPGANERLDSLREETLDEIGLFELRRALDMSQTDVAEALDISQAAVSQLERSKDLKLSTLRRYLSRLGAHLELVAVFDDGDEEHKIQFTVGDG